MATAYVNGNIYTMKAEGDTCDAFVVDSGKFIYCGTVEGALNLVSEGEVVDLQGITVLPGMIDTHQHLFSYSRDLLKLNLKGVTSIAQLKQRIRERAQKTPKGQWILGTGFDQEQFDPPVLPTKADLDEACPDNPLIITRYCLHINVANSLALEKGGIVKGYVPPVLDTVAFDENNEPTGVLWDQAAADIIATIPDPLSTKEARKNAVEQACRELNKYGLTGVHPIQGKHCDLFEYMDIYQDLDQEGRLTVRVYLGFDELAGCSIRSGLGNDMVQYGFFKIYTDGSMGARSAYLNSPYEDAPDQIGIMNYTQEQLEEKIRSAYERDVQVGVHVIGDRAAQMLTDAIEKVYSENPKPNVRFRMIHMSLLNEDVIRKIKGLPVVIDIQPMFVSTNVRWSQSRIGAQRVNYLYCWRRLLDEGLILSAGSDSPIETYDPMKGVYAIVTRQGLDGYPKGGFTPRERVSVYEAVSMYTRNAAYASFEEDKKGTIEPGKLADFVMLSADLFQIAKEEIKDIRVLKTYLSGVEVYALGEG